MNRPVVSGLIHGTSVAFKTGNEHAGALIVGAPGSGKSELALELMALGARLVADDQTRLGLHDGRVMLSSPTVLRGLIEMRFVGLLRADTLETAPLALVVDLDTEETDRLPEPRWQVIEGCRVPLLRKCASRAFAAAIRQYLVQGPWHDSEAPFT